jgi:hypothetical protein
MAIHLISKFIDTVDVIGFINEQLTIIDSVNLNSEKFHAL